MRAVTDQCRAKTQINFGLTQMEPCTDQFRVDYAPISPSITYLFVTAMIWKNGHICCIGKIPANYGIGTHGNYGLQQGIGVVLSRSTKISNWLAEPQIYIFSRHLNDTFLGDLNFFILIIKYE